MDPLQKWLGSSSPHASFFHQVSSSYSLILLTTDTEMDKTNQLQAGVRMWWLCIFSHFFNRGVTVMGLICGNRVLVLSIWLGVSFGRYWQIASGFMFYFPGVWLARACHSPILLINHYSIHKLGEHIMPSSLDSTLKVKASMWAWQMESIWTNMLIIALHPNRLNFSLKIFQHLSNHWLSTQHTQLCCPLENTNEDIVFCMMIT